MILIIHYEFYDKLKKEKKKIYKENFQPYKDLLKNFAAKYENVDGPKDINKYDEHLYIKKRLPDIKLEISEYDNSIGKYDLIDNHNNILFVEGNPKIKIIKWYNNNNSMKFYDEHFIETKKISHCISNIGLSSIIKLEKGDKILIEKLGLYLVNSMFICISGEIDIKKNKHNIQINKNNDSCIIMLNDNINVHCKEKSCLFYLEFMGHSFNKTQTNKFVFDLYKYFIGFL